MHQASRAESLRGPPRGARRRSSDRALSVSHRRLFHRHPDALRLIPTGPHPETPHPTARRAGPPSTVLLADGRGPCPLGEGHVPPVSDNSAPEAYSGSTGIRTPRPSPRSRVDRHGETTCHTAFSIRPWRVCQSDSCISTDGDINKRIWIARCLMNRSRGVHTGRSPAFARRALRYRRPGD